MSELACALSIPASRSHRMTSRTSLTRPRTARASSRTSRMTSGTSLTRCRTSRVRSGTSTMRFENSF